MPRQLPPIRIPQFAAAVLEALQFSAPEVQGLKSLDEYEWQKALAFCDAGQLTLLLGRLFRASLPDRVRSRIDRNHADNADRFLKLNGALLEISHALGEHGIDFTLLKGLAHSPAFTSDPLLRAQGDIDLWCQPASVMDAKNVLFDLGYRSIGKAISRHLDPMVRQTSWTWHGDFFDPDLPIPVDLHYKLWDEELEHISALPEQEMWGRRSKISLDGYTLPTLSPSDTVAFAALHLIMHVFHGDVRLQRAWELAHLLNHRTPDDEFWSSWRRDHPPESRKLRVVAFLLADCWFQSGLPQLVKEEAAAITPAITIWLERFGFSPLEALLVPNKDELWLNLALLNSFRSKASVFWRRLLPIGSVVKKCARGKYFACVPRADTSSGGLSLATFLAPHASTHPNLRPRSEVVVVRPAPWTRLPRLLGRLVLFDFGEFIFFLLYNLYLLDVGKN